MPPPPGKVEPPRLSQPTYWWLQVMGRLKPGVTAAQVQGNLEAVFQQTARSGLDSYLKSLTDSERAVQSNSNRTEVPRLLVQPGARGVYDVYTNELRSVTILGVVVTLVLLIVCANVANLLLSRATTRQKELSVRLSLGATRWRLVRQLLTESLLLAGMGGALGIVVGYWGKQLLPGTPGQPMALDWKILGFVMGVSCLTGLLFGIAPALRGTGVNVSSALKETSRSVVGSRTWLSKALLIVQVAISLVLVVGASLFLRTLSNLRHVDVGFNPQNLLLFRINPGLNGYDQPRTMALYRDMLDRLATVPGVSAVAMSSPALLSGSVNGTGIFVNGRSYQPNVRDRDNSINRLVISPNFFEMMSIPVQAGRAFSDRDTETAPKVVIINQAAAKKYFPNENPVGQRFGSSMETTAQLEIVGVVRDVKYDSVRDAAPPTMFVPYVQTRVGSGVFEVRTHGSPGGCDRRGPRSRQADGSEPAAHGRLDATRTDRAAVRAGKVVRAGLHTLRRPGAAARRDRALRPDVVQRLAAHQRDRHPHGARRPKRRRAAARPARVDDPRRRRRRCRPRNCAERRAT